jgi:GTP-binding protein
MLPVVVIAGRPNVGKSTLFNRLVGRRTALVADTPGVTRDRKEAEAMLRGRRVLLVDTAGLEEAAAETLPGRLQALSGTAVAGADLVVFVVDARAGLTSADRHFAHWSPTRPRGAARAPPCWTRMLWDLASRWRCRPSMARASPT